MLGRGPLAGIGYAPPVNQVFMHMHNVRSTVLIILDDLSRSSTPYYGVFNSIASKLSNKQPEELCGGTRIYITVCTMTNPITTIESFPTTY